ncbi:MAG: VanZ family protein [Candidatus Firestonebacteria bacterium]|nr:VanZ family protein [Candidatus Firestonebacteria bacterium]
MTALRKSASWLPAAAFALGIFYMSSQSNLLGAGWFDFIPNIDKLAHTIEYFILASLICFALRNAHQMELKRALITGAILAALYGITDEYHQSFIPQRSMDIFDWLADLTGAFGALLAGLALARPAKTAPKKKSKTNLYGLVLVFLLNGFLNAAWPQFRGNSAQNGVAAGKFPEKLKILWTYEAKAEINSTPAVSGNFVYIGTGGKKLLCLDLLTGKKIWEFVARGAISSSALVLDGNVYFGDEAGVFYALETAGGKELWRFKAEQKIISSPNYASNGVLFGSYDGNLYFLKRKTGEIIWSFETNSPVHGSPLVLEDKAVFAGCDGELRFIEISSGKELFSVMLEGNIVSSPSASEGKVFLSDLKGTFFCVETAEKKILWQYAEESNEQCYSSPVVNKDKVIFGSRGNFLRCLNKKNGKPLWSFTAKDGIDSSPVITGGEEGERVYFGSSDGKVYGLKVSDGKKIFEYDTGSAVTGSLAVSADKIVFGNNGGMIFCFTGAAEK